MRTIPPAAKRGDLRPSTYPYITIKGEQLRLAPGALIFDTDNRTILYGYLPESAQIAYVQDGTGHVMRIYLLTAREQEQLDKRAK